MLKTLARKETRELLPLVILGVVSQLYLTCTATGMRLGSPQLSFMGEIPFVGGEASSWFFLVSGAAAMVFGLWQTLLESTRGTFQFLLHRPMPREAIFGTKLLVGGVASLFIALLPIACYSLWAAAPGTHASPFEWAMTASDWQACAQIPLIYFGAFLSGLRPGRWFGSRLLPLAGGLGVFFAVQVFSDWWWAVLPASLAAEAGFAWVIFDVGRTRDFS